jgi:polar amino acid transport system substrate-binding protein
MMGTRRPCRHTSERRGLRTSGTLTPRGLPGLLGSPGPPGLLGLLGLLGLFGLLFIALPGCGHQREGTQDRIKRTGVLKVGTDATYPPFETVDPGTGQLAGFDIDLVRALAAKMGVKAEFIVVPFDGIIPGLKSGKYDLVISAMTITPERARQVRFTDPYTVAGQSVVVRADETGISGVADLVGRRVGCQLATTGELEARKIQGGRVTSFDAIGSAFRDLENRNLEAVIADTPTARIFIRDHPTLRLAGDPLTREEFGMAVRPEDDAFAALLNRTLNALRSGGEMSAIETRWGIVPSPVESGAGGGPAAGSR